MSMTITRSRSFFSFILPHFTYIYKNTYIKLKCYFCKKVLYFRHNSHINYPNTLEILTKWITLLMCIVCAMDSAKWSEKAQSSSLCFKSLDLILFSNTLDEVLKSLWLVSLQSTTLNLSWEVELLNQNITQGR